MSINVQIRYVFERYATSIFAVHFFIVTVAQAFASTADHVVVHIRTRAEKNAVNNCVTGYFRSADHVVVIHNELILLFIIENICSKEVIPSKNDKS